MQCSTCKAANRDGIQFCEECGARLSLPCPSCGSQVPAGKKFCGICGASLGRADSASPALLHPHPTGSSPAPIDYTPDHLAERILSGRAALEGERKIVTVLFSDIRGSMDIMERLDPEEAKRLLDPCLQLMMQAVHRFEGTVNRILGDGIMALFGAPLALEDHPQRALYAALEMHEQVGRYAADVCHSHGIGLQIRVGINTGEVVVRTIGDDLCMDYSAVGHAVGLAVYGPRRAVIVRRAFLGIVMHVRQDAKPQLGVLVQDFPLRHLVPQMRRHERVVLQHLPQQLTDSLPARRAGVGFQNVVTRSGKGFQRMPHVGVSCFVRPVLSSQSAGYSTVRSTPLQSASAPYSFAVNPKVYQAE